MGLALLFLGISLQGQSPAPKSSAADFERVDSTSLQNGCKIIHITNSDEPWDIYVAEIDLSNPDNQFRVAIANGRAAWIDGLGNTYSSRETLADMIARREAAGEEVIAAINSDFFNMANGMQFNVTALKGIIASTGITADPHAAFYSDQAGEAFIGMVRHKQKAALGKAGEYPIHAINMARGADQLILYNSKINQAGSGCNQWGLELLLQALDSGLINGVISYKVIDKAPLVEMQAPDQVILSGHGKARVFLDKAETGDLLRVYNDFEGLHKSPIVEMVGGWGHIVKDGLNRSVAAIEEEGSMIHENERHPRSAIGYNKSKTKLYLVVVDGRSKLSAGMNLDELANFMIEELGVWEGLNFDGGGSTTLMAGSTTVNNPSGGTQRAIANALLVVNKAPAEEEAAPVFETQSTEAIAAGAKLMYEVDPAHGAAAWVMELDRMQPGSQTMAENADQLGSAETGYTSQSEKEAALQMKAHVSHLLINDRIGWSDAFNVAHQNVGLLSENLSSGDGSQTREDVIVAVNASAFNTTSGAIDGLSVKDGYIASYTETDHVSPSLCFNQSNDPFIANLELNLSVIAENGASLAVNNVNGVRWLDYLTLYNSYIGEKTPTNRWGAELRLVPSEAPYLNGVSRFRVTEKVADQAAGSGGMSIGEGEYILSGNSAAYEFIRDQVNVDEEIRISSQISHYGTDPLKAATAREDGSPTGLKANPATEIDAGKTLKAASGLPDRIISSVPGTGIVMLNGDVLDAGDPNFYDKGLVLGKDLRTAVGYNSDKSKLYFFVSDAFTESHTGMELAGLKALMKKYRILDGLCLSGGFHSTMITGDRLVNKAPEEETSIANALVLRYLDPTHVSLRPESAGITVFPNPAGEMVYFDLDQALAARVSGALCIQLYDIGGRMVKSMEYGTGARVARRLNMPLHEMEGGLYMYRILDEKGLVKQGKLMVTD